MTKKPIRIPVEAGRPHRSFDAGGGCTRVEYDREFETVSRRSQ